MTEEPVTHAGALIGSETAPLSVDSAPVTVAEETVAAPVAVGKPSLAPIVVASAPAPVLAAPAADADTTNHVAVADTPGAATPLDQVTPTARSAPSYGDVFHTLQVDAEAHAASSLPATAAVDPSTSYVMLASVSLSCSDLACCAVIPSSASQTRTALSTTHLFRPPVTVGLVSVPPRRAISQAGG